MSRTIARTLTISTGTSRGRDTYGYRIVRLRDSDTGKLYRCNGGGYDMVGTVLAAWLTDVHQDALRVIAGRAYYVSSDVRGYVAQRDNPAALYGMHFDGATVRIDGACGVESVLPIAEAAGVKLTSLPSKNGQSTGWLVADELAEPVGECDICGQRTDESGHYYSKGAGHRHVTVPV